MSTEFPIIEKLGGPKAVAERLQAMRVITHPRTVGMWHTRGRISADGMLALMRIAELHSVTYCSHDFANSRRNAFQSSSTETGNEAAA